MDKRMTAYGRHLPVAFDRDIEIDPSLGDFVSKLVDLGMYSRDRVDLVSGIPGTPFGLAVRIGTHDEIRMHPVIKIKED